MTAHLRPRIPRGSLVRLIMPTLRCAPPIGLRSPAGTGYLFVLTTLIGLAALTTACGSESEGSPTAIVRDSAGIRIVENPTPAPASSGVRAGSGRSGRTPCSASTGTIWRSSTSTCTSC